jgi:site-specific DNA-adenine methylase
MKNMANYGFPYMGSKDKIADRIITALPAGKRLVDLFGGGGSISHCAVLSNKWGTVVYNELNQLAVKLFKSAINGDYSHDKFKPAWVSREDFFAQKDSSGYVKYIWSFGNKGNSYLFGEDIENYKRILHNAVVFNDFSEMQEIYPDLKQFPDDCVTITQRRLFIIAYAKIKHNDNRNYMQLERPERLQQLERLERLQELVRLRYVNKIEIINQSYLDVELQDGDIIYCDPPYAKTAKYSQDGFNHDEFWDWVRNCPHCVIVSEYSAPDDIQQFGHMEKLGIFHGGSAPRKTMIEKLFWNGRGNLNAGNLFE